MIIKNVELREMGKRLEECKSKLRWERHLHGQARTELAHKDEQLKELREKLQRSESDPFWQQKHHDRAMREAYLRRGSTEAY